MQLAKYIHALCPQQAMDEYTAEAWHDVLGEFGLAECHAAVVSIAKRQPFIAPSEVITEVERERRAQLGRVRRAQLDQGYVPALNSADRVVLLAPPTAPGLEP